VVRIEWSAILFARAETEQFLSQEAETETEHSKKSRVGVVCTSHEKDTILGGGR
jgi:hypothetical protein